MYEIEEEQYPEVKAYLTAYNESYINFNNESLGDYYYRAERHEIAMNKAWEELQKSENPLIKWIADNCAQGYRDYGLTVLQALRPDTTIDQLNTLARLHNWCYEWGHFRDRAIAAGVFSAQKFTVQMKVNGGGWGAFWEHSMPDGKPLTYGMIAALFNRGASFIQIDAGTDSLKYQTVDA